ncbi:MFS transporter [Snodgrassella communis]|uniref:MFS transporter n=1 Tax=Snodgrassella communis TaxID=2946699 RepID=UPI001EF750B3|nr:MFS transporter [Snodgrassella communis]
MSTPDILPSGSQFAFARTKRFLPLFGTQFFGVFNDNLFKTALFVLISFYGLGSNSWLPASQMLNAGALLYILPYFLFSALSGELSNKLDKAILARWIKATEICIMLVAGFGFWLHSVAILMLCLFLMGTHSTLFGPLKYAILPEYLSSYELLNGNSLIESGTFLSILLGQIFGTILVGTDTVWLFGTLLFVAMLGQLASMFMPRVPAQIPQQYIDTNILRSTRQLLKQTYQQKSVWIAIIGISWFWLVGSVYITQLPTFTRLNLGGNEAVFNLILTLFSLGIGSGSIACARLSRHQLHLSLVMLGAFGITIFGLLLIWVTQAQHNLPIGGIGTFLSRPHSLAVMLCIIGIGFCGGFFSLPLYTWLQTSSSDKFRAHAVAANNIINGLFMVCAAILSAILIWLFNSINVLYFIVALGNIPILFYLWRSPELRLDFKRFILRKH